MNLKGLSEKQVETVIKYVTRKRNVEFWGESIEIEPCLIENIQGDGMQLIYLSPIDSRPNYYIIRIDSSIDVHTDYEIEDYPSIEEMLLQMVEEENENIDDLEEHEDGLYYDPEDKTVEGVPYKFPMLSWGGGSWGQIEDLREQLKLI